MQDVPANPPCDARTVSEARLLSVLDTAVDGIIVIDSRARILVFNKACEALFGYEAREIIGQNIKALMPPEFSDHHDQYLSHYHETGERRIIGIGREVRGMHRDGTIFPLELSVGEAQTPDGRQFIGVLRDLRARKAVEHRLNQLQAQLVNLARISAMDEMGAAIAHELNQPLTAVMLYLQAILRKKKDAPDSERPILEILGKALREAERAGSIIQRMRQFVEKREPERQAIDLEQLIDEALELTLLGHDVHGIELHREKAPDMPRVEADPVQIQQIVCNLVRNGLEAMKGRPSRVLRVSTRTDGNVASVEIQDSGPGIPGDVAQNLFRAFSTSKRTGLGLGLAISRTIAQNHGGDLVVDPGGEGRGARFILSLPLTGHASAPDRILPRP
ncbi:two-component system sensor histidine kinase NtrB [Prosthecodimorpha staleyi]|uniref:Sensor protein FixL n=1 Tax=Prosthecodimorpha staleyi TaxID=2840188 RepID=A0A947GGE4_9HYPH|nr:PAS domain S-box protein [Prosthecodimorpha staleyi]MBT9292010.1 PAS domain S-box protein [Prosthecodimorpha staleyi]